MTHVERRVSDDTRSSTTSMDVNHTVALALSTSRVVMHHVDLIGAEASSSSFAMRSCDDGVQVGIVSNEHVSALLLSAIPWTCTSLQ